MGFGVAFVKDEVVGDGELFEEPEYALGLGVLGTRLSVRRKAGEEEVAYVEVVESGPFRCGLWSFGGGAVCRHFN